MRVSQRDGIAPVLFDISSEEEHYGRWKCQKVGTEINIVAYADDIAILAHSEEDFKDISRVIRKFGLKINENKQNILNVGGTQTKTLEKIWNYRWITMTL